MKNDFRANLVAFYKSISIYIPDKPRTRVEVGVKAQKTASVKVKVFLPSVGALEAVLISLFLLTRAKL